MDITARSKKPALQERLMAISGNLGKIRSGESKPEVVEYRREGDRISVRIKTRDGEPAA